MLNGVSLTDYGSDMDSSGPLIRGVTVRVESFSTGTWLDQRRISTPMARFPRFAERRSSWRGPGADVVWVHVETEDDEVFGIGQTRGGAVVAEAIRGHLLPLLLGQDVREVRRLSEECARAMYPYGAGGLVAMATSAVELATWDAAARAAGVPLFRLLGGTPGPLPYYLTMPAADIEAPASLLAGAALVKVPMPFGPADGAPRLSENLAVLEAVRDRVPDDVPLAVDCFMSWDVPYAVAFAQAAAPLGLHWIEEPLAPEDLAGHRRLRDAVAPTRVAGGEHVFGLRAGTDVLASGAVDVVQPDVTWCGGLATARGISEQAAAGGVVFAPHNAAAQPWALHLLAACPPPILTEVLLGTGATSAAQPPAPVDAPGVGVDPGDVGF